MGMYEALVKALKKFIDTDATGHAFVAYGYMERLGLLTSKVEHYSQWTPAYAAGLLSGIEEMRM